MINALLVNGQNTHVQTISGTVYDAENNPLSYVSVYIPGTTTGITTDEKGKYNLSVPKGEFTLKISSIEYEFKDVKITMNRGESKTIDFTPLKSKTNLSEVTVTGKSTGREIREKEFSVNVIDLGKYANTTTDINQVLRKSPGVTIRESGGVGSDFSFKINGLDAKIFIDGVPMDNFGSSMTLNNIPVNLIERVEVYKGVVPAYLGTDVLGGAVNIITKSKNRKFLDVSYGYGSFNTHQASVVGSFTEPKSGLTVKMNGFYNYSDNDYDMYTNEKNNVLIEKVVPVDDKSSRYVTIEKAKRFHDMYHSAMGQIELGFENKKWTDRFLLGVTYSGNKKQNQLGATVNTVKGGQWSDSRFFMPTLSYRKNDLFVKRLFADIFASYSNNTVNVRDTATYNYDWSGNWIPSRSFTLDSTHNKYIYRNFTARANLNYDLNEKKTHSLNLNYNFNTITQHAYDKQNNPGNKIDLPSRLGRHIVGLALQSQFFKKKLISSLAFKFYGMDASKTVDERENNNTGTPSKIKKHDKFFKYYSGSMALRYRFTEDLGLKFSAEKAYNLPSMTGLFGDGQNTLSNWDLKPEQSNNLNIGGYWNMFINKDHYLNLDASYFLRKTENYITTKTVTVSSKDYYQYYNQPGVKLYGFEADIKYGYKDIVQLSFNGSYDKAIDNKKFTDENNSQVSITYNQQLANRPWLYGNAELTLSQRDLLGKNTRVQVSWSYQYIHWYYLSWENLGSFSSKDYIPAQNIHSAVATYSWNNDKYNFSLEARNLTNELCYDNFRLQKPGRAFYAKFRISIM